MWLLELLSEPMMTFKFKTDTILTFLAGRERANCIKSEVTKSTMIVLYIMFTGCLHWCSSHSYLLSSNNSVSVWWSQGRLVTAPLPAPGDVMMVRSEYVRVMMSWQCAWLSVSRHIITGHCWPSHWGNPSVQKNEWSQYYALCRSYVSSELEWRLSVPLPVAVLIEEENSSVLPIWIGKMILESSSTCE